MAYLSGFKPAVFLPSPGLGHTTRGSDWLLMTSSGVRAKTTGSQFLVLQAGLNVLASLCVPVVHGCTCACT